MSSSRRRRLPSIWTSSTSFCCEGAACGSCASAVAGRSAASEKRRQPMKAAARQSQGERIRISLSFSPQEYGRMSPGDLSDKISRISGRDGRGSNRPLAGEGVTSSGTGASWIHVAPATVASRTGPAKGRIIQGKGQKAKRGKGGTAKTFPPSPTYPFAPSRSVDQQRVARLLDARGAVAELVAVAEDLDERRAFERALYERLRERVFDVLLQRAPERPRPVGAVGAGLLDNPLLGLVGQADFEAA